MYGRIPHNDMEITLYKEHVHARTILEWGARVLDKRSGFRARGRDGKEPVAGAASLETLEMRDASGGATTSDNNASNATKICFMRSDGV